MPPADRKTAVVIGAGPAGLTAAFTLLRETGIHPIVCEQSGFVGGISRTVAYGNNRIDLGGHRFFSKNERVTALWQELMPLQGAPAMDDRLLGRHKPLREGGPDPEREEAVMLVRDRVSRIFYLRKFFDYPISLSLRTFANLGLARTARAGAGYLYAAARRREERSLEDFYINRFGRPLYEMFFEDYTRKLWGVHPSGISPEWGAQRVRGLSLSRAVGNFLAKPFRGDSAKRETSLIERYWYPKKGPGQFWELMAGRVAGMGGEIRMNEQVVGVEAEGGAVRAVRVRGPGGETRLEGDFFFSSMPVADLVAAMGRTVPEPVRRVAAGLPYRDFITVGLLLRGLKIRSGARARTVGDIVPDCWIYIQERDVKIGRLQIFNNWSPYMVADPLRTVWVGLEYFCGEGDELWTMPPGEFIRFAVGELEKIGIIDGRDVLDATHIRVKKAYPAYFGSYGEFGVVREYLDGLRNLYCVGRNGQHRYNNMDHSMLTAIEAVNLVRTGSADRSPLWNVNAEEEYHERK